MIVKPFEAYQIYTAVKLHFESESYDALKYNFRTNATQKSFLNRRDRFHFAKLAKKYPEQKTLVNFLVANFVKHGKGKWAGDLLDGTAEEVYRDWLKRRDSFSYYFTEQVNVIAAFSEKNNYSFEQLFARIGNRTYPTIVFLAESGSISIDTLTVFDELLNFMKHQNVTETIFWPEFEKSIRKYRPFLRQNVDLKKCKQIALKRFANAG